MRPAIRTQVDMKGDEYSDATRLSFEGTEQLTRQEFKKDTDTKEILQRYGVGAPTHREPVFGVVDYDMDLQQGLNAVRSAQQMFRNLPPELRDKYKTWQSVLAAAETGELDRDLHPEAPTTDGTTETTNQPSISGGPPNGSGTGDQGPPKP